MFFCCLPHSIYKYHTRFASHFCFNLLFQHPKSYLKVIQPHVGIHRSLQHSQSPRVPERTPDPSQGRCTPQSPPRTHAHGRSRGGGGHSPRSRGICGHNHGCGGVSQRGRFSCTSCRDGGGMSDDGGKVGADAVRSDDFVAPPPAAGKEAKKFQGSEAASC